MKKIIFILLLFCSCLALSSCENRDIPTFEEYKAENPHKDEVDWDWEYGDLMFHADGTLRDQDLTDNYTAEETYGILVFALFGVFVLFAGVGTGGRPIPMLIVCILAIIGSIVIWNW